MTLCLFSQIFDEISYQKGSCVIRMVATYLGEDVFLKGIKLYLKKHEYGNTKVTSSQTQSDWIFLTSHRRRICGMRSVKQAAKISTP